MTLHLGLDTRAAFLDPYRGLGRVTRALADALVELHPGAITLFVPHGAALPQRWYTLARVVALRRPRRGAFLADGPAWRWCLRRHPVDALHLPAWGVPPGLPCPTVATFHDATPLRVASPPGWWPRRRAQMGIRSLRRATVVHAVSRHAATEAAATLGLPAERISVAHWGVGAPFVAGAEEAPMHVLFVGGADRHKNLEVVLAALGGAAELPPLLLAGPAGADPTLRGRLAATGAASRVEVAPALTDDALAGLYRRALATVVPSPHEGFGLPALEAMACGSPVLAANAGALPEVCGDAAVLLDPAAPDAWAQALRRLASDRTERARLRAAGLARASAFTWRGTAEAVWEIYLAATRRSSPRS